MSRIPLRGARNVRDMGDFATRDGRRTANGRLYRADTLARLTDADVTTLGELGLRTIVDFRSPQEIADSGPDRVPTGAAIVRLPIAGGNVGAMLAAAASRGPDEPARLPGGGRAARLMMDTYRQFVTDAGYRAHFATALRLIADQPRQPLLFHCTAGKDRTGWMAAIVLTALDVPREVVLADYLATNDFVWPAYRAWAERLAADGVIGDPDLVTPLLYQDAAYLNAAFEAVDGSYRTFARFLTDGLDFADPDLDRLRTALLR